MTHLHLLVQGLGCIAISAADAVEILRMVVYNVGMRIADVPGNPFVYDCSTPGDEGVTVAARQPICGLLDAADHLART